MNTVQSKDGTAISFDAIGDGPPVILVDGALCYRGLGPSTPLAELLGTRFTVLTFDRRGRGDSGDTAAYAVEREVEDVQALIEAAGGSAYLFGISSGAALALEVARRDPAVKRLALYEAPFIVDDSRPPIPREYAANLARFVAENRGGDAVKLFLRQVGAPAIFVAVMPLLPVWSKLKAVAHTLPYDAAIVAEHQTGEPLPADRWASVEMASLVLVGGKSPAWLHHGAQALSDALPNAELRMLEGQTHNVKAKALAPVLTEFFRGEATAAEKSGDPVASGSRL